MSDLIDRRALLATLNDLEATGGHKYYLKGANDVLHDIMPQIIADEPAVDAVEVVRCKNCKMYCPKSVVVPAYCTISGNQKEDDDFCSYGERVEEEAGADGEKRGGADKEKEERWKNE